MGASNAPHEDDKAEGKKRGQGMLRPHGGYRKLRSFQTTEIIYDATYHFCDRFVTRDRERMTR